MRISVCILAAPVLRGIVVLVGTTRSRSLRPEGAKIEAEDRGRVGFLEMGRLAPSPPARGLGERCKLPQRVWGGAAAEIEFWHILA